MSTGARISLVAQLLGILNGRFKTYFFYLHYPRDDVLTKLLVCLVIRKGSVLELDASFPVGLGSAYLVRPLCVLSEPHLSVP